jgi:hypothetical protein
LPHILAASPALETAVPAAAAANESEGTHKRERERERGERANFVPVKAAPVRAANSHERRNAHALHILERVKCKLDGRDAGFGTSDASLEKKLSIEEQVLRIRSYSSVGDAYHRWRE